MEKYKDALSVVADKNPHAVQYVFRPHLVEIASRFFLNRFRGKVAYAVKANSEEYVLRSMYNAGVNCFDVASISEVRLIRSLFPDAFLYFMHTVKSRHAVASAYHDYGVRHFSLDSIEELDKIVEETNSAKDLALYVRIAIPNTYAKVSLAGKFGIGGAEAIELLRKTRKVALKLGISFHVGSQCMNPEAYRVAIRTASELIKDAGVEADIIDVGGGFPSIYSSMQCPPLERYFDVIHDEFNAMPGSANMELMCEPGRALVAESGAEIVRVELIKGKHLYINDGTYGGLFDAGIFKLPYPVQILREDFNHGEMRQYSFFGPTCDAVDFMPGPFLLPVDIKAGEYFEIGQLGAYSRALATSFNGFTAENEIVAVEDMPLLSLYTEGRLKDIDNTTIKE
ncbi:type III PLP-dependent enzyme [Rickettsiales endosymbiont of Peranema trichophorum]|uniref:type III PLP-dependent enzyme n=1 Tax=Rickettsiales endosymbiont of Peranema trichophorum TaxID=2486577 RepID=UPI0010237DEA|nr:type III PLP-dependent enzyme [Rickettsiales endosymbiont of Peranema trichophorum]RZI47285.1 type III PLP-dependent enzyme [Rickettsiales endosymbiont of Peranema trichophorum]